ncbi:ABC transporter permease [Humisphaera borealis]|uniref:ABC transporter permease n=2 Tax=Humisphaera borealis TaxID=2807512 RepID=A0A7M2WPN8_9BACT|nr:ABC transporter permease [Humisphaera borealis]
MKDETIIEARRVQADEARGAASPPSSVGTHPLLRPVVAVGSAAVGMLEFIGQVGFLFGDAMRSAPRGLVSGRGRRLGWQNLWAQMVRVGVKAVPIVMLVLFCIGAILALQMAPVLKGYGAVDRTADIISIAVFRELGPLVAAVVLTGFAGASIAAELGSMVVSEEIEALEAQAISPVRFLVLPRVIGTTIMMVCVAVVADLTGVLGGMVVGQAFLGIEPRKYITYTFEAIKIRDFVTGLVKAGVFGMLISSLACHLGLSVTGGAQGVGAATTRTVVLTIVALIIVDLMFTAVFYAIGW